MRETSHRSRMWRRWSVWRGCCTTSGHGPFGHFFDDQYLSQYGITHEDIGAVIIEQELG